MRRGRAFMVVGDHVDDILVEDAAFLQYLQTVIDMPRHLGRFFRGQIALCLQQCRVYPQFTDIHQHTTHGQ